MFLNDHITIDNILIDVERNIDNIAHLRNGLYEIFEIEDFKKLRGDLSQFLYDLEGDIRTVLDSLIQIQEVNRKYYDSFAMMQNNESQMAQRFNFFEKENKMLQERLIDCQKQIDHFAVLNVNQEKYITELIDRLRQKEKKEYGCQLTRNPYLNSTNIHLPKSFNYDYSNMEDHKPFQTQENDNKKSISLIPRNKSQIQQDETEHRELINSLNNAPVNSNTDLQHSNIQNTNQEEETINRSNDQSSLIPLKETIEHLYRNVQYNNKVKHEPVKKVNQEKKEKYTEEDEERQASITFKKEDAKKDEKSSKIARVQNIIIKSFKNEFLLLHLKSKFGKDFLEKITTNSVKEDFITQVEYEVTQYENVSQKQESKFKENEDLYHKIISQNINPDKQAELPESESKPEPQSQIMDQSEPGVNSSLRNYFMFNLFQDKMLKNKTTKKKDQSSK